MIHNTSLKTISKFANFLLLFSIIIDPTNALFGIKDISFIFFVIVSIPYINLKYIYVCLIFLCIFFITFAFGLLTKQNLDIQFAIGYLKSFLFLFYVLWMTDDYLEVFKTFYSITLLMSVIVIFLYFTMSLSPILKSAIYFFLKSKNHVIMVGQRNFLGFDVFSVYYRTSATCTISLSIATYLFFTQKKIKYFLDIVILFLCLFFSGTRANMLSGILIISLISISWLFYKKKSLLISVTIFIVTSIAALSLIFLLLNQKTEQSIYVKTGHLQSLLQLFTSNPIQYALIGSGPGTIFYTTGGDFFTSLTELTYLELIKNHGLLFTIVLVIIIIYPYFKIIKNSNIEKLLKISIGIGFLAYLFIAGTNPLLIGSTGFIVIAVMYYISNKNFLKEIIK